MSQRLAVVAVFGVIAFLFNVPAGGGSLPPGVTVSPGFVGVGKAPAPGSATVTWYGEASGEIGVLWASDPALDIRPSEGAAEVLVPEFAGPLGPDALAAVTSRLQGLGGGGGGLMPAAGAQTVTVVCSLEIANPWYSFTRDAAVGSSAQTCSGHVEHFVESKIRQQQYLNSYRTIGHAKSGWGAASFLQATAYGSCNSSAEKRWKNWGNGDAIGPGGVFFNGPSASTDARKLGCKH